MFFCKIKGFKKEILQGILFLVLFVIDVVATQHIGNNKTAFTVPTASLVPVSLLAFWAGNIYKKYKAHVSLNIYFAIISLIGIIISCQFVGTNMGNFFIYPAVFLVNSVLGIYLNLYLSKILVEKNAYKIIEIIGKNSLTILALHIICFKAINLAQIYIYNLSYSYLSHRIINMNNFWWIAYSIVGVLIPVILALGANKVLLFLKKIISKQLA
ncbi:acyltransferase family protein [Clostridium acetobutylicum]|uniref:acyltransferase family protein n=1 Tax=Clostridium acetobutylicum TaxID=1488 RepID=UPI00209511B5|nr:acyltransferase family protein [Clostridium acetobutylicum]